MRIDLPDKRVTLGAPHSGDNAWWSNNDQSWADVRLTRTIEVPAGGDVRFWSWNDYTIEELWDYGFIEVSTDGGDDVDAARRPQRGRRRGLHQRGPEREPADTSAACRTA